MLERTYEMINYVEYRLGNIETLVEMIREMKIDQYFDFYIQEGSLKTVFSCKKILFREAMMMIVGQESDVLVNYNYKEWMHRGIALFRGSLEKYLEEIPGELYLPEQIAAAKEKPWYTERWYAADLFEALKYHGIETNPNNMNIMKEACKNLFTDRGNREEILQEKARELFLNK